MELGTERERRGERGELGGKRREEERRKGRGEGRNKFNNSYCLM